jgi:uncharacterized membrane protein
MSALRSLYAVTAIAFASSSLATTFELTDLGVAPGYQSSAGQALNDAGTVVGESWDSSGTSVPTRFSKGRAVVLLKKAGQADPHGEATTISPNGTVAGVMTSDKHPTATLFVAHGKNVTLAEPAGIHYFTVLGVNDAGTAVGTGGFTDCPNCGFVYAQGNWTFAQDTRFNALDNDGRMVGSVAVNSFSHAARFLDGTTELLPDLGGYTSWANGFNSKGDVVGASFPPGNIKYMHAYLIRNGQAVDLHPRGYSESSAYDINDQGWIVGHMAYPDAAGFSQGGRLQDLNTLLTADAQAQWTLAGARRINNKGQISGTAIQRSDGVYHAVLLTPLPAQ